MFYDNDNNNKLYITWGDTIDPLWFLFIQKKEKKHW
jgi:hypothetical protein